MNAPRTLLLGLLVSAVATTGCRTAPEDAAPAQAPEVTASLATRFDPLPPASRPRIRVSLAEPGNPASGAQRIEIVLPGMDGPSGGGYPGNEQMKSMITNALIESGRFAVVDDYQDVRAEKELEEAGIIAGADEASYAERARYAVRCTLLEYSERESSSGRGIRIGPWSSKKKTRAAVVRLQVRVTDLASGLAIWAGEATGKQESSGSRTRWSFGLFGTDDESGTTPTLSLATQSCVVDMIDKLVASIPVEDRA